MSIKENRHQDVETIFQNEHVSRGKPRDQGEVSKAIKHEHVSFRKTNRKREVRNRNTNEQVNLGILKDKGRLAMLTKRAGQVRNTKRPGGGSRCITSETSRSIRKKERTRKTPAGKRFAELQNWGNVTSFQPEFPSTPDSIATHTGVFS